MTPARFEPHEIGPDYVIGRFLDDLDINYAEHYSYTTSVSDLFSDTRQRIPGGVVASILFASPEGWMGTATDSESGDYCALAYGFFIPMGWTPGMVICP